VKNTYKKYNDALSKQMDKHPVWTIFIVLLITYQAVKSNQFLVSIFYIALAFCLILIYGLSKIKTDKNTKVFLIVGIFIIVFIGVIYIFAGALTYVPNEYRILDISEWVNVLSIIFGGFLTMFGVWYSIEETKKHNENVVALQSIPLVTIDIPKDFTDFNGGFYTSDNDEKTPKKYIEWKERVPFLLNNTSSHIAKNFRFTKVDVKIYSLIGNYKGLKGTRDPIVYDLTQETTTQLEKLSALPGGYSERIYVGVIINVKKYDRIRFDFTLEYSDYLGKLVHSIESTTILTINKTKEADGVLWKNNISYDSTSKNRFII
jgi:hypothetical protein